MADLGTLYHLASRPWGDTRYAQGTGLKFKRSDRFLFLAASLGRLLTM